MIRKDVLNKIKALEQAYKRKYTPFLIMAKYVKETDSFQIVESYSVPKFTQKTICVKDLQSYKIPDDFEGSFIYGAELLED